MSKARNMVISGLYNGSNIELTTFQRIQDKKSKEIYYLKIILTNKDFIVVNEQSIKNVEFINKESIQTDTGSSIARGIAGGILLGGAGLVAGAGMGKQSSINTIEITWTDDQKSLLEIDANILSELNKICWNIQNNITGSDITKEEILLQVENSNKQAKGSLLSVFAIILACIFPPLWCLVVGYIVYELFKKQKRSDNDSDKSSKITNTSNATEDTYNKFLYCISILIFLSGIMGLFGSIEERYVALVNIFIGIILYPPVRTKMNDYFLPKFNNQNILYGIIKFFVVCFIVGKFTMISIINMSENNTSITQPSITEQVKTIQKVEQQKANKEIQTQTSKSKINNKSVKSENNYYSVANTLENYYKNYFNADNWYVKDVTALDNTIFVNMVVVDPTWQENIKKHSSSRQYMVNCACPNSYTDIWHKISKNDVSVTIYDVYGKRIGGGVCTN